MNSREINKKNMLSNMNPQNSNNNVERVYGNKIIMDIGSDRMLLFSKQKPSRLSYDKTSPSHLMKGTTMKARIAFISIIMVFAFALTINAGGKNELQKYFSDAAKKVKATDNPVEKRQILSESFENMSKALDRVQDSWLISKDDQAGIESLKATLKEKQDELAGINGYERVSDQQLNSFSDYVVQDTEQADQMITISLVTLILIIILIVLLV
jgi:hypothetical protein